MIALSDGIEIAYDDVGSGPPIAFIHGFPHNRSLWSPQLGALVDRARCVAPDLRGFGESSRHGPYTMDQYADDVALLLKNLGIPHAVIVGLSLATALLSRPFTSLGDEGRTISNPGLFQSMAWGLAEC